MEFGLGGEFDDVEAEDLASGGGFLTGFEGLPPEEAAGLGGSGGGHEGGVESIDVEGEVDVLGEVGREEVGGEAVFVKGAGVEVVDVGLVGAVVDLFLAEVADADLEDGNTEFVDAAHDAGVAVRAVLVGFAEVGVGVDLDDPEAFAGGVTVGL